MIRMKEGYNAAGPEGVLREKHTYTLHRDRERQLVDAGAAEYVAAVNPAPEPERQPEVETAVAEPRAEKAVKRRPRPKGR
jgi:hypothetical protein